MTGITPADTVAFESLHVGAAELARAPQWRLGSEPDLEIPISVDVGAMGRPYVAGMAVLANGKLAVRLSAFDSARGGTPIGVLFLDPEDGSSELVPMPTNPQGGVMASHIMLPLGDSVIVVGNWPGEPGQFAWLLRPGKEPLDMGRLPAGVRAVVGDRHFVAFDVGPQDQHDTSTTAELRIFPVSRLVRSESRVLMFVSTARPLTASRFEWGPEWGAAAGRDRIWVWPTARAELFAFSADGEPRVRVVWEDIDRATTEAMITSWKSERIAALPERLSGAERVRRIESLDTREFADTFTAIVGVRVGSDGKVYVRPSELNGHPRPGQTRIVFDTSGALVATLFIPPELTPFAFYPGYLYTIGSTDTSSIQLQRWPFGPAGKPNPASVPPRGK